MATQFQLPHASPVYAGASLSGAKLFFFEAGTTTPITTYTTSALSVAHNHPVEANSEGVFPVIWINEAVNTTYRVQLKTSADVLKQDDDNQNTRLRAVDIGAWAGTAGGSANAITITPSPAITAYAVGQCFRFLSAFANTSSVTIAVSGLTTKAITKNGSTALISGDIPNGSIVTISYDGTQFQMSQVLGADFGTYTGTLAGCTTSPTVTVKYAIVGKTITLHVPGVSATSNTTACTLSGAPASLRPANQPTGRGVISEFFNNSSAEYGAISCEMNIGGVLSFRRAGSVTGFTNTGTKGPSDFMFTYILNTD